nr:reverse transcriptase domain-containing protein [Tanacetum cinerariifolium]
GYDDNNKRGRSTARSLYHPHQMVPETDPTKMPPAPLRNKGDPDDHLKESAATIKNWPQPVWCHMFISMLVGNARNWFSKKDTPKEKADTIYMVQSWQQKTRQKEDEDMSLPWRRQKVDVFTRRISDFSKDKRRRMPANVKTYDGTGDPNDHLKIFESAATIENWPQPVWCHMFNSTLVGNARNWFSKLPRRSIDGFEEGDRGNDKYTPLTKTPKEILVTEGANFPKPPQCALQKSGA